MENSEVITYDLSHPGLWVPAYLPLIGPKYRNKRRKLLYGGRDGGRSTFVAGGAVIARMLKENFKGLMVRKAYNSIKESQVETIKILTERWELEDVFQFKVSPIEVVCLATGARLIAKGMDNPGKAKSVPDISLVWYEEFDEISLEDFTQTTLSIRGKEVEEWMCFNTPDVDHWICGRFFPQHADGTIDLSFEQADGSHTFVESVDPKTVILHTCHQHNTFLTEDRRSEYEWQRDFMPEQYRSDGLGLFGRKNIGSLWLKQFSRSRHTRFMVHNAQEMDLGGYRPDLPVHLTFDQNNLPYSTCLVIQVVPIPEERIKEVRILRELCMKPPKNTTEHACDEFIYHYGHTRPQVYIYGDPTGGNRAPRKTKNEALTHYDAITTALRSFLGPGYNRVSKFPPSIKGRQKFMERVLADGTELRIVIDPSCKNTIGDFEHLVEDENGGFIKKRVEDKQTWQSWEERGHCMDALVNCMSQCFPDLYKYISRA